MPYGPPLFVYEYVEGVQICKNKVGGLGYMPNLKRSIKNSNSAGSLKSPLHSIPGGRRPYSTLPYSGRSRSKYMMTLDLETRRLANNNLEVISCSVYDGSTYETFYLPDYGYNQIKLLGAIIGYLIQPKNNKTSVYCHN
jgi:hypothetical protein